MLRLQGRPGRVTGNAPLQHPFLGPQPDIRPERHRDELFTSQVMRDCGESHGCASSDSTSSSYAGSSTNAVSEQ